MTLREELAKRLEYEVEVDIDQNVTEQGWLLLADECIRQMEWARNEVIGDQPHLPLTLAPEDWKP